MKKTVLYIGNFSFPYGNASGKRVYANGKMLKDLGYEVIFIGMSNEVNEKTDLIDTKREYDGFVYYNFPYPKKNKDWLNYRKQFKNLTHFLRDQGILKKLGIIIYYGSPAISLFNTKIINYGKENNIKVFADCVDWLSVKTNSLVFDFIKWADTSYQKAYANKKADGVITISKFLSNYYNESESRTVVIPPLSPETYGVVSDGFKTSSTKILTYAGLPFRKGEKVKDFTKLKDRIDIIIVLIHRAKTANISFIFNIYGFTKDEYLVAIPHQKKYIDEIGEAIVFHGYTPNEEVVERVNKSDFTILIRDVNRDTTAGFPTKVSESISYGTPVITTKTSDLEDYITEGIHGFFIDNNSIETASDSFNKILEISSEEVLDMKVKCSKSNMFYYKNYSIKMKKFLDD